MTNSNEMHNVKMKLADFDACMLCLFAMHRMKGYMRGTPTVSNSSQSNYSFMSSQSVYFVRVNAPRVGKCSQFPLRSKHTESGASMFNNGVVGESVCIDNTALEDAIHSQ